MIKCSVPKPEFYLVGTVRNIDFKKKGKVKRFELETPQGTFCFKIPHKLHKKLNCRLYPNAKLEARGKVIISSKKAKIKLKLERIRLLSGSPSLPPSGLDFLQPISEKSITPENSPSPENNIGLENAANTQSKGKILLCRKSSCWKRGGKVIYKEILKKLQEYGLEDSVAIEKTGCMGHCKSAPNLVVFPGKNRYRKLNRKDVGELIDIHFLSR